MKLRICTEPIVDRLYDAKSIYYKSNKLMGFILLMVLVISKDGLFILFLCLGNCKRYIKKNATKRDFNPRTRDLNHLRRALSPTR